jgi:hypothetical protein
VIEGKMSNLLTLDRIDKRVLRLIEVRSSRLIVELFVRE